MTDDMPADLAGAARAIESLLRADHPNRTWIVDRHPDADDRARAFPRSPTRHEAAPHPDHSHPVNQSDALPAARSANENGLHEAA